LPSRISSRSCGYRTAHASKFVERGEPIARGISERSVGIERHLGAISHQPGRVATLIEELEVTAVGRQEVDRAAARRQRLQALVQDHAGHFQGRDRLRQPRGHALQLAQALLARAHALLGCFRRLAPGALRDQAALGVLRPQPLGEIAGDLGEPLQLARR
jgi:hypothetical protein